MATNDSTAAARARVAAARAALDSDVATLTDRLPGASAIATGGAAGGTALTLLGIGAKLAQKKRTQRSRENELSREATIQAKAIASAMAAHAELQRVAALPPSPAPLKAAKPRKAKPPADTSGTALTAQDDSSTPWGIILLLLALAAAVVAIVTREDDEDLWVTPVA